jgi:hypothetical protein
MFRQLAGHGVAKVFKIEQPSKPAICTLALLLKPECGHGLAAANAALTLTTAPLHKNCAFLKAELCWVRLFFLL